MFFISLSWSSSLLQVTNPAIDPLREGLVMSLEVNIGKRRNILEVGPENASQVCIFNSSFSNCVLCIALMFLMPLLLPGYSVKSSAEWRGARVTDEGSKLTSSNLVYIFWYPERLRWLIGESTAKALWSSWWSCTGWLPTTCSFWSFWGSGKRSLYISAVLAKFCNSTCLFNDTYCCLKNCTNLIFYFI